MSDTASTRTPLERKLVIESIPEMIHQVEQFIEEIRDILEFKEDAYGNIMVAVTEAVNNAIMHGNSSNPFKKVTITCKTDTPYRLEIFIEDEGEGFDWQKLDDPTSPENINSPGGRGVFLMTNLADEIDFRKNGSLVQMSFNI